MKYERALMMAVGDDSTPEPATTAFFESVRKMRAGDSPSVDAFGRWRVSSPYTILDTKQIHDGSPLYWDDEEVSGSGTTSTHSIVRASTRMAVSDTTAGKRIRQTYQWLNYQPGKSQLVVMTASHFDTTDGITKQIGLFNDDNGLLFRHEGGTAYVVRRTQSSGVVAEEAIPQRNWNLDRLDGTGPSGIDLDFSKTQIFAIDFEWLGVGRVRFGFDIDGVIVPCHELLNANRLDVVYISTPNLPLRYTLENDGTGTSSYLDAICVSVMSEGGFSLNPNGVLHSYNIGTTHIDLASTGTQYPVIGLRLKADHLGDTVLISSFSLLEVTGGDAYRWSLLWNPTLSGALSYGDIDHSGCQAASGNGTITISDPNVIIDSGYVSSTQQAGGGLQSEATNALHLGSAIDGTRDQLILAVTPLGANLDIYASLNWRELD